MAVGIYWGTIARVMDAPPRPARKPAGSSRICKNALIIRNLEFRKSIQPSLATPNAGSVFKNPPNDSAGRLLDKAGVKSFELPSAKVWDNHANFIVNKGSATSEDILTLMVMMYNAVKKQYTIELKPEIIFIGDKTKKEEELWNILYQ
jgi:UDP-N-acetylmuramate dehydrogenase